MRWLLLTLLFLATTPLTARDLYWQSIDVKARLDEEGRLHVVERQRFVFNGDWNGGERVFRVEDGQGFELRGMRRIDASGASIPMTSGDLRQVDQYFLSGKVLRWRSRLPSDPPFENTVLTYEIEYVLSNILIGLRGLGGRRYLLNHDFAFPDRSGRIEQFAIDLEVDPSWRFLEPLPPPVVASGLLPGESFFVRRELAHRGSRAPGVAFWTASPFIRYLTLALVIGGMPLVFIRFWLGERARGRFVRPTEVIDQAWLEEHIFSELPEVIGYMYDQKCGPPEVAAVLARMTQQGRIVSSVERRFLRRPLLKMTLQPTSDELLSQEERLVKVFFVDRPQDNTTDTDRIRACYRTQGFDPAASIENAVAAQAAQNPAWRDDAPRARIQRQRRALGGAFALLIPGAFFGSTSFALMLYMAVLGGLACWAGRAIATRSAARLRRLPLWWLAASAPLLLVAWMLTSTVGHEFTRVKEPAFLLAAVFLLTAYWFVLKGAVTRQSTEKMLLRARIVAARRWFVQQLRSKVPSLRDDWTPYLLALGLGRNVDRWFSSFGGEVASVASSTAGSSFGSSSAVSSSGSSPAWSGGGGSFGGAGATGSWAAAATSLAAGASAPTAYSSSSSGSSGGSSSGSSSSSSSSSSSGGGGGGGW